ncbi:putative TPR repeat methyltransferase [Streptosporangium album]|uniref:Putative TPR repeat methyltransferase n=1 Tax=Streptosporangium album TaxID=47479 RepID=A0A7W7RWJ4_9ACTN|nr:hypothetical protein [Streptosporangium album]MBB4939485.1 putative TPR repeat methyltransferase [Streptosporangium album]
MHPEGEARAAITPSPYSGRLTEVGHGALEPRAWFRFGVMVMRRGDFADAEAAWRRVPQVARDAYAAATCAPWIMHRDVAQAEASFRWVLELAESTREALRSA